MVYLYLLFEFLNEALTTAILQNNNNSNNNVKTMPVFHIDRAYQLIKTTEMLSFDLNS